MKNGMAPGTAKFKCRRAGNIRDSQEARVAGDISKKQRWLGSVCNDRPRGRGMAWRRDEQDRTRETVGRYLESSERRRQSPEVRGYRDREIEGQREEIGTHRLLPASMTAL